MCWLPVDEPLLLPGDSTGVRTPSRCSVTQLLASRLRRVGDQLEKSWTAEAGCGDGGTGEDTGTGGSDRRFTSFLRAALRLTVLVLLVTEPHV